ncbi:41924_t:CDS:2 [Gigaspora margarita]|uniref:41924_t:CDS:1 n=1 Tax=Gigaspora margarita TaxID=4874 RepID=A0ABN7UHL5_GIGMA|nr:41924_t:CDS:2 [Gigaspora margarita]
MKEEEKNRKAVAEAVIKTKTKIVPIEGITRNIVKILLFSQLKQVKAKDKAGVEGLENLHLTIEKGNRRTSIPDSDKGKRIEENTMKKKKGVFSHNKENEVVEHIRHKDSYSRSKKKESYNEEKMIYIKSLDEKLQIILQKLDKIESNKSRECERIVKGTQKNQLVIGDWLPLQRSQLQNIQQKDTGVEYDKEVGTCRGKEKKVV